MKVKKRTLVDIGEENRKQFEALQRACTKAKAIVPTVPYLTQFALRSGMEATVKAFWPSQD